MVNLKGCSVVNCSYSFHLFSSQNTVKGCVVEAANEGIALYESGNRISRCNFSRCNRAVTACMAAKTAWRATKSRRQT
ncbi:MAG: right-handed parallel beta-helix repeat-containing protein [Nitrososphaerota archaeon]